MRRGRRVRAGAGAGILLVLSVAVAVAGCGSGDPAMPVVTAAAPSEAAGTPGGGSPAADALSSPVDGILVAIDAQGFSDVRGFTLRTDAGRQVVFHLGTLENGAAFPPAHLAEHLATSSRVRVWFRTEGADLVVYRIEDAPA